MHTAPCDAHAHSTTTTNTTNSTIITAEEKHQ